MMTADLDAKPKTAAAAPFHFVRTEWWSFEFYKHFMRFYYCLVYVLFLFACLFRYFGYKIDRKQEHLLHWLFSIKFNFWQYITTVDRRVNRKNAQLSVCNLLMAFLLNKNKNICFHQIKPQMHGHWALHFHWKTWST